MVSLKSFTRICAKPLLCQRSRGLGIFPAVALAVAHWTSVPMVKPSLEQVRGRSARRLSGGLRPPVWSDLEILLGAPRKVEPKACLPMVPRWLATVLWRKAWRPFAGHWLAA